MSCVLGAIVAVTSDWAIGLHGDMVVANKADMRHFVEITTGHPVIMGRKTLEFSGWATFEESSEYRAYPRCFFCARGR